jgi:hypothetical protein
MASVEGLQLCDEALILFLSTNDCRQFARQKTAIALRIYFED